MTKPGKPVLVWDGTCAFCKRWIDRWKRATGDRIDYEPFQDAAPRFPDIPESAFAEAVHFIEPDGRRSRGAEAVFRALATAPHRGAGLWAYRRIPGFAAASEWAYRFVARHRPAFSRVTDWLWGPHVAPPGETVTCWLYVRLLAIVFAIAFLSLWAQVDGLIGSGGILPASTTLHTLASAEHIGADRYRLAPTLCWLWSGDWFLMGLCAGGVALSAALLLGIAPIPCLIGISAAYLSLATVCREFLWFQWDGLLLEGAFLALFLPPSCLGSRPRSDPSPPRGALRLTRWLLFRLLVASAAVKLLSGDTSWRDLVALQYHYETQPLPTWLAWYAHHLPLWFHRISAGATLLVEGLVPFLIWAPRRVRFVAAATIAAHQLLIAATGNYGFFNLLILALCVLLLDDAVWPRALARIGRLADPVPVRSVPAAWARRAALVLLLLLSFVPLLNAIRAKPTWLGPLRKAYEWVSPFRIVNHYGLFAIMTKERNEIQIEGSSNGVEWKAYAFPFKPGDPERRPGFVAPHQPRLDWQMWFAALSDFHETPWFLRFCEKLLLGSEPVLRLMRRNPFPESPPRYLRAVVYRYRFTDPGERREAGWWRRERLGLYCPVLTLEAGALVPAPEEIQRW